MPARKFFHTFKGVCESANDSVNSFLLHPSEVPQVMSILQQLYTYSPTDATFCWLGGTNCQRCHR